MEMDDLMEHDLFRLKERALKVRGHILRMAVRGGCFVGSALSCTDIVVFLYSGFLKITKDNLNDPGRDYLLLSKGHAVPVLYGTFAELGFFHPDRLKKHLGTDDSVYWHPNRDIPGIEFHAGSLGHIIAVASGVALDCKMRRQDNRVAVIIGDGELNEGSVWETLLIASAFRLDNLVIVIDRNRFQANAATEDLIPLEPLISKLRSFGMSVRSIDGHDFRDMKDTFPATPFEAGKPSVVIAHTIRGKGLPEIENRADKWFCKYSDEEADRLIKELTV